MPKKSREYKNFIWNLVAGLINAGESVILSFVIVRTSGLEDAGIVSIAFAIGNLLMTIGKYGVRTYQVTDRGKTAFSSFFTTRILTVLLMFFVTVTYLLCKTYSVRKMSVIFGICFIYMIEAFEDVFAGHYQEQGYLYLSGMVFTVRWSVTLLTIILILLINKNIVQAVVGGVITAFISEIFLLKATVPRFSIRMKFHFDDHIKRILIHCFPLFAMGFLSFYIVNSPKFSIDKYMNESVQACYGFIAMPVFVISLLSSVLYQPILVAMTEEWAEKKYELFRKSVLRQVVLIIGITALFIAVGSVLGIPALSLIYNTDLSEYRTPFLILLAGGGALAIVNYFSSILTLIRKQRFILYGYTGIAATAFIFSNIFVVHWGVVGAGVLYSSEMALLGLFFVICFMIAWKRRIKSV